MKNPLSGKAGGGEAALGAGKGSVGHGALKSKRKGGWVEHGPPRFRKATSLPTNTIHTKNNI